MIIQLQQDLTLLGTNFTLKAGVNYTASWATNQRDWQDKLQIFTDDPTPIGFLLSAPDYTIVTPDRPLHADYIRSTLRQWLGAVEIPDDSNGEEGHIVMTDAAMLDLIQSTKRCLADLDATLEESDKKLI